MQRFSPEVALSFPSDPYPVAYAPGAPLGQRVTDGIGNTPLVRLTKLARAAQPYANHDAIQILGKAEWHNPGGSVKDRAAWNIVSEACKAGQLGPGRMLLDSTSGNTGIAYAMLGAAMGFPVTLCVPANVSPERKRFLNSYGATIVWTDPDLGSDGAIRKVREMFAADPDKYFYADQYSNDANWRAHYMTTGPEIWRQTEGRVTHFVSMLGTSGTFMGTARKLKEMNSAIQCISLQPDSPFHGIEGAKHMPTAIVPGIYDPTLADANIEISTEAAYAMCKRLAREEGLLVGISAAAAVVGAEQIARTIPEGERAVIVTILCDSADKYLSERFWEE